MANPICPTRGLNLDNKLPAGMISKLEFEIRTHDAAVSQIWDLTSVTGDLCSPGWELGAINPEDPDWLPLTVWVMPKGNSIAKICLHFSNAPDLAIEFQVAQPSVTDVPSFFTFKTGARRIVIEHVAMQDYNVQIDRAASRVTSDQATITKVIRKSKTLVIYVEVNTPCNLFLFLTRPDGSNPINCTADGRPLEFCFTAPPEKGVLIPWIGRVRPGAILAVAFILIILLFLYKIS